VLVGDALTSAPVTTTLAHRHLTARGWVVFTAHAVDADLVTVRSMLIEAYGQVTNAAAPPALTAGARPVSEVIKLLSQAIRRFKPGRVAIVINWLRPSWPAIDLAALSELAIASHGLVIVLQGQQVTSVRATPLGNVKLVDLRDFTQDDVEQCLTAAQVTGELADQVLSTLFGGQRGTVAPMLAYSALAQVRP
jgi:hypothetical protein